MKIHKFYSILPLTLCCALPAHADLTPQEVWEDFKALSESMGVAPEGEENRVGDDLVITNLTFEMQMDMGPASTTSTSVIPELIFKALPGGKVEMLYAGPMTTITNMPENSAFDLPGYEQRATMTIEGATIAEGDPGAITYLLDDVTVKMLSEAVVVDGFTLQPGIDMQMGPLTGSYSTTQDESIIKADFDVTGESLVYKTLPFEAEGAAIDVALQADDIALKGKLAAPVGESSEVDFLELLQNMDFDLSYGLGNTQFDIAAENAETGPMRIQAVTEKSELHAQIVEGALTYGVSADALTLGVQGMMVPGGGAEFSLDRYETSIGFPITAASEPVPAQLNIALENLVLPEIAWMMFDPAGQLPRDPATFKLDLGGTMTSEIGLFDFDKLVGLEPGAPAPFDMKTAELSELFLSIAGAQIKGDGSGTFVDGPAAVPGGIPAFAGKISLELTGITGLIDTLSSTGLLPAEQAMGAQMMLGLLARPGSAPNVLVSEIEIDEAGKITANGAPLPF